MEAGLWLFSAMLEGRWRVPSQPPLQSPTKAQAGLLLSGWESPRLGKAGVCPQGSPGLCLGQRTQPGVWEGYRPPHVHLSLPGLSLLTCKMGVTAPPQRP